MTDSNYGSSEPCFMHSIPPKEPVGHFTDSIDTLIRDLTKVGFMAKSEARRRIQSLIDESEYNKVIDMLNLINTEPIHTVEVALLGWKSELEAQLEKMK